MTTRKLLLMFALALPLPTALPVAAESWNGKSAAIALTYDDALDVHLDIVKPHLDVYGMKATFYVTPAFPAFAARLQEWKQLSAAGHELGNHTLFHPCEGGRPGREWVAPERDLATWTVERFVGNVAMTNLMLEALTEKQERTFAYPCGDTKAQGTSYVDHIKPQFVAARGVHSDTPKIAELDLFHIPSYMVHGQSTEELIALVDEAIARGGLLVFLFHGVGGGHDLNVSEEVHAALLNHINAKRDEAWVAPLVDIAEFVRGTQKRER
jgi:peptidoglycan/xylan/chitin deacetylase (PgdA/CDA1 family)